MLSRNEQLELTADLSFNLAAFWRAIPLEILQDNFELHFTLIHSLIMSTLSSLDGQSLKRELSPEELRQQLSGSSSDLPETLAQSIANQLAGLEHLLTEESTLAERHSAPVAVHLATELRTLAFEIAEIAGHGS